jgi:apolipoprotein N-acyltransferase
LRLSSDRFRLSLALILAAASGALLSLALPPADLGFVAFLAPIPLVWLVRAARPGRGFLLGLAFGVAYFGTVLYWILRFGELAWGSLTFVSAAFIGVFGLLAPAIWRGDHPVVSSIGLAALWTVIEWVRDMWPVGGFAWGELGSTQTGNPFLLRLASVAGVWGISLVVMLTCAWLLLAIEHALARRPARAVALVAASFALVFAPGLIRIPMPNGRPLDVAAIQVDVRRADGLPALQQDHAVAEMNMALDRTLVSDPPDLAVWGESSLDPGANLPGFRPLVVQTIREVGVPTLAGATVQAPDGRTYNESLLFGGDGRVIGEYRKVHLVPFGEYVPFRRWLDWISALEQIPYDDTPGERAHTLRFDDVRFGDVICFENSFPSIDRELVRQGAGFLVVTTNNASYGFSAASRQHLAMSRLRAVENARWVVHAAVSGISAFIDPTGKVIGETQLFRPTITRALIRTSTAETIYTRLGDWVPWSSLVLCLGLFLAPSGRRRAPRPSAPLPHEPRTLVVLPTYNESETIEAVIDGLLAREEPVDILVVDDGSPDGTGAIVRRRAERDRRIRLIERSAKMGVASAYYLGFRRALDEGYDLAVQMDSDLSHQPDELPRLLDGAHRLDLTIGSRYVPGGSVTNWSRLRLALSRGGNLYARLALGFPLHDATSGYRVYRRDLLEYLLVTPSTSRGYAFQIEMTQRAWSAGFSVGEIPITFREREHGRSKISRGIVLEALWLVALWGFRARFSPSRRARSERP